MPARSYVEPDVTKDWHKLDVKHVSGGGGGALQYTASIRLLLCVLGACGVLAPLPGPKRGTASLVTSSTNISSSLGWKIEHHRC